MNDKCICEKCGVEMKPLSEIYPIGMTCPNCGWGWATTYIDPINLDESDYQMILVSSENSFSNIKIISEIANCNYIDAKKKIGENNDEVMQAIDDLKKFKNGEYADSDKLSNAQILKNASAFLNGEYTKMVTGNETKVEKLHSSLNHFLHKYSDSDMELKKAGSDYKKAKADAAHQKERDEKIRDLKIDNHELLKKIATSVDFHKDKKDDEDNEIVKSEDEILKAFMDR